MRCCAPFCRNALDNVPASQERRRISFHGFPSDARLHAAWLKALGKQGAPLPDPAVVCSQHFLDDDIHETESGSRHIDAGAIPSTVLVCLMCLDTDGKMFLMSKHKLEEAYKYLTGYAPCNQGNLKQTLCVQCAQRLMNFSRFRDQSLRARALMMDLVEKHELITRRHIKMINRTKYRLKGPMVVTTRGADFCDLYIQEDTSDDKQTESETTIDTSAVKTEESEESMAIREDMDVIYEEDDNADSVNNEINEDDGVAYYANNDFVALHNENISDDSIMLDAKLLDDALLRALQQKPAIVDQVAKIQDLLKFESADFKCSLCSEEFVQDLEYMEHMSMHAQSGSAVGESGTTGACERRAAVGAGPSLPSLAEIKPDTAAPFHRPDTAAPLHRPDTAAPLHRPDTAGPLHKPDTAGPLHRPDTAAPLHRPDTAGPLHRPDTAAPLHRPDTAGLHDGRARPDVAHTSVAPVSASVASSNDSEEHLTEEADAGPSSEQAITTVSGDLDYRSSDSNSRLNDNIDRYTNCIVKLYDVFGKKVPKRDASLTKTRKLLISCDSHVEFKNTSYETKSQNEGHTRKYIEPATDEEQIPISLQSKTVCLNNDVIKQCIYTSDRSSHIQEKLYICDLCRAKFQLKSLLIKHIQSHMTVNRFTCEICQYKCQYKCRLTIHMMTHTGEKPFSCKLCEYKTALKYNLAVHMKKHTGEKPYSCKLCEYKSAKKSHLIEHMRKHTGEKPYSCKLCEYKTALKYNLAVHMKKHTGEKPYSCKLCEYKSAKKSHLIEHMRKHTGEKPYSCKLCEYKAAHKSNLIVHMSNHTGEKPYSCKLCEFQTAHSSHLVVHMRRHSGEKPFFCKLCEYKAVQKSDLVVHIKRHTGEKPFSCKLCEYKSVRKRDLVLHMRKHTGEKSLSCKLCEYRTAHKNRLTVHMRNHTGEKPYSCKLCPFKTTRSDRLVVHMRIHTGEKPYSCELCGYKTAQSGNLGLHMRKHTGEKPYSCKLCEHKTANLSNLTAHLQTHR